MNDDQPIIDAINTVVDDYSTGDTKAPRILAALRCAGFLLDADNGGNETGVPPLLELMWRCDTHNCDAIPRLGQEPDRCWKGEFVTHLSVADCSVRRRGFVLVDFTDWLDDLT